jgi:hypothetical protein
MSATANVIAGKPYEERTQLFLPVAAGKTDELLAFFQSPLGLPFTASRPGLIEVRSTRAPTISKPLDPSLSLYSLHNDPLFATCTLI